LIAQNFVKYHGIAAKVKQAYHQQILSFLQIKINISKIEIVVVIICVQMCFKEVAECGCVQLECNIYKKEWWQNLNITLSFVSLSSCKPLRVLIFSLLSNQSFVA